MSISIAAQAFLIHLGTGSDGLDSFTAVRTLENWGCLPEDVLPELSKMNLVMSVHEPDGQEIIFLSVLGLSYLNEIAEGIRGHYFYKKSS